MSRQRIKCQNINIDGCRYTNPVLISTLAFNNPPRLVPRLAMASQPGLFFFVRCCADFERISLNAVEERVLPPDVRIKIVCAQANAVEQEEELLEADVSHDVSNVCFGFCGVNVLGFEVWRLRCWEPR